jgi:hypothetical protein
LSVSAEMNRYAPPSAHVSDVYNVSGNAAAIRREHIKHEASVRSIGGLYLFSGSVCLFGGLAGLVAAGWGVEGLTGTMVVILCLVYGLVGALSIAVGGALRALQPWARTVTIVLSVIGLIGFPIGTIMNAYILYLLCAAKGKRLFEPDYQGIIDATPEIKYKTSIIVWIFVGLLGLLIVGLVAAALLT